MTQREKILAAIVVASLLLVGLYWTKQKYDRTLATRRSALDSTKQQLLTAKLELERGREAVSKLDAWQKRSLPSDPQLAQSLYRTWLLERAKAAGLAVEDIQPNQRLAATDAYAAIGYKLTARGSLKSLATLMFDFYRSPLLQQVTRLQLRPASDASQLDIGLEVEALALPGATTAAMPEGTSERFAKKRAPEYTASIGDRNLFAVYTPPRPVPTTTERAAPPPPPEFDASKHAYVTGIVQVDGRLQAWITVRTTGEVLRLFEGDPVKVGTLEGKIVSIGPRNLVLESGDEQTRVDLGKNLREGKAVPKT